LKQVSSTSTRSCLVARARLRPDDLGRVVRKAMTSCLTSGIDLIDAATSKWRPCPCPDFLRRLLGMTSKLAMASAACASISNQMRSGFPDDQIAPSPAGCSGYHDGRLVCSVERAVADRAGKLNSPASSRLVHVRRIC